MTRITARLVLGLATLLLLPLLLPGGARGETATPVVGTQAITPADACDPAAFPAGETGVTFSPLEDFGFVAPAASPDHNLYLTLDVLPPGSCLMLEDGALGAATFLVLAGEIEFLAWPAGAAATVIEAGDAAGNPDTVDPGTPVTLATGGWATVDQAADFAFRNPGATEAKIVTAFYEPASPTENGCSGGCRRRP